MNPRQMRELERQHEVVTYRSELLYSIDGHPINPKQYGHWKDLTQKEKNNLYSKYIFLCEQER